jgi:site-specific recombinase XerD
MILKVYYFSWKETTIVLVLREYKRGNETYYKLHLIEETGKDTVINEYNCKSSSKQVDGKTYRILFDSNMRVIESAFDFLNYHRIDELKPNTKKQHMQALKLLFCYQDMVKKDLREFSQDELSRFKIFLRGITIPGSSLSYELKTQRGPETINNYLLAYRDYLNFLGCTNHFLHDVNTNKFSITINDVNVHIKKDMQKHNVKKPKEVIEVPRYISVDEMSKILKVIRKDYTRRDELIVRMMYESGLRIGEVFGSTLDDIKSEKTRGGRWSRVIFIRNRVSDKEDQRAKTCMYVYERSQYSLPIYSEEGYDCGYQKQQLTRGVAELLEEYIEEERQEIINKYPERFNECSLADRVTEEAVEYPNSYIFLNSLGRPLSQDLWNRRLREIHNAAGIPTDIDKREKNLNHKYRHGFAMYQIQKRGMKLISLQKLMRHQSIQSTEIYYNPTEDDQHKLLEGFEEALLEDIPELTTKGVD